MEVILFLSGGVYFAGVVVGCFGINFAVFGPTPNPKWHDYLFVFAWPIAIPFAVVMVVAYEIGEKVKRMMRAKP